MWSRSRRSCGSAACACCTTSRGAAPVAAGSTSCTPRTPAESWWSSSKPAGTGATDFLEVGHTPSPGGYSSVDSQATPARSGEQLVKQILDAILTGDTPADEFAALELPESYLAVTVHKEDVDM